MDDLLARRLLENNFLDRLDNTQDRVSLLEKLSASIVAQLRDKYPFEARLTLETGVYFSITDQLAKTVLYLTRYNGNQISFYDGVSSWSNISLSSDVSIKTTDAQTGTTHNGTKIIDGLTDTSQLVVGMKISGTNVGVGSVIASVDSSTQITGTVNSTGTAANTITFKCPANTVYDVFCYNYLGVSKLELVAGTVTRTTQDGTDVKTGATTRRLVGTILITATDGQLEMSRSFISISNRYNQLNTPVYICPGYNDNAANTSYAINSTTYIEANGGTGSRINFVLCKEEPLIFNIECFAAPGVGGIIATAVGLDTITNPNGYQECTVNVTGSFSTSENNKGIPLSIGSHYASLLFFYIAAAGTAYADLGGARAGAAKDPAMTYLFSNIMA